MAGAGTALRGHRGPSDPKMLAKAQFPLEIAGRLPAWGALSQHSASMNSVPAVGGHLLALMACQGGTLGRGL